MLRNTLTILTETPTLFHKIRLFLFNLKQHIKYLLSFIIKNKQWREHRPTEYSGHHGVTRSIVEGLRLNGTVFNYNPTRQKDIAETVFVPANQDALAYALHLKKNGKIKTVLAGPNLAVLPIEITSIPHSSLIDTYLQPSTWVVDLWQTIDPHLPFPVQVWYAGVDTTFWKPSFIAKNTSRVLLYKKHVPDNFFLSCKKLLEEKGFIVEPITYGSYTKQQYLEALQRNCLLVHFTESESQGISLAEAWSTDTPTLVWNPKRFTSGAIVYDKSSSAPYLTQYTGAFFTSTDELLALCLKQDTLYTPRLWCTEHMSDGVSAKKLLSIIEAL